MRHDLETVLVIKRALKRCPSEPVLLVNGGEWYNWELDNLYLPCESHREMFGETVT
jgi:hypothetical protein